MDGGIDALTGPQAVEAGASCLVAGSAVFGHPDGAAAGVMALRDAIITQTPAPVPEPLTKAERPIGNPIGFRLTLPVIVPSKRFHD